MKRLIFFILLVGGICAASYFVLFSEFTVGGTLSGGVTIFDYLKEVFKLVKGGNWDWKAFNTMVVFAYGLTLFFFVNAVLLVSLLVMLLTTLFNLSKVYRFYATVWWFLFASALLSGTLVYVSLDAGVKIMDFLKLLPWQFCVPLGAALVLCCVGIIFKRTEKI